MKYNDIAVIGMSLLMPGAENTDELHDNLAAGKDLVRKVPESRFRLHGLDPQKEYIESGYLENIEMFDNKFFNISDYESKVMSPEQRLSLELLSFEDGGIDILVGLDDLFTDHAYSLWMNEDGSISVNGLWG